MATTTQNGILRTLKALITVPGTTVGESDSSIDRIYLQSKWKSVPDFEFRWSNKGAFLVYQWVQMGAGEDKVKVNFAQFTLENVLDTMSFVVWYRFLVKNRANSREPS